MAKTAIPPPTLYPSRIGKRCYLAMRSLGLLLVAVSFAACAGSEWVRDYHGYVPDPYEVEPSSE